MTKTKRHSILVALILLVVSIGISLVDTTSYAQTQRQTFPETGKTLSTGFLDYWNKHGGLAQFGYPISNEMAEVSETDGKTYAVQYFERAVFEYHPENAPPNNVLLSLLGVFEYKAKYGGAAPGQRPNMEPGSVYFGETGKRVGNRFLDYWRTHGGLAQQGYPISDEFPEVSRLDGKPYVVQYFERAVFEYHPENQQPYDVLLSQLGTFHYKARYGASGGGAAPPQSGGWQVVSSPREGTQKNHLFDVAVTSQNDAWGVGTTSHDSQDGKALIQHWDGHAWQLVPGPQASAGAYQLSSVAAISASDAWAVGQYVDTDTGRDRTLIEHWDGSQWNVVTSPNVGPQNNSLSYVTAVSATDVWAVGGYMSMVGHLTLIIHWDGTQWNVVPSPNSYSYGYEYNFLNRVDALSANNVWAVGFSCPGDCFAGGPGSTPAKGLIEHWDGTQWSIIESPGVNTNTYLWGVAAVSANDVWVSGRSNSCYGCVTANLFLHWNGSYWSIVPSPNAGSSSNTLNNIVALNANDIWAAGGYYANGSRTLTLHWNGSAWNIIPSPNVGDGENYLDGVAASSSNDVWAVGSVVNTGQTLTLHWTGQRAGSYQSNPNTLYQALVERFSP